MNNIKMSEMTMVGTWLYHWFPRTYPCITYLAHQCPLSPVWPQSRSRFTVKLMKYYSSCVKETWYRFAHIWKKS